MLIILQGTVQPPERKTLWCPATVRLRVEILVRGSAFLQKRLSVSMSRSNLFCLLLLNKSLPLPSLNVLPKEWIFSFFGVIVEYFLFSHFFGWYGFLIFISESGRHPNIGVYFSFIFISFILLYVMLCYVMLFPFISSRPVELTILCAFSGEQQSDSAFQDILRHYRLLECGCNSLCRTAHPSCSSLWIE